ncbi:TPA: hypothetical protein DEO28_00030 [Candidatus Dependentiae bacterium]|nr:MAG: hypothetical protein UR14_C0001G0135 [candidate division TM6 bacterium GW2011_GWE2_31_21]KKP53985.1 MAG: hypothetical protein UR43_C0001G0003 [candidate division TM6 bacterium GW2011_GWF2_33_332]HBS48434.1 hypothetical protein [Candidatus Dependentiae bacterium]HBZ72892.1 hypothetical protein [Candidatus Dependentiae bacterium]
MKNFKFLFITFLLSGVAVNARDPFFVNSPKSQKDIQEHFRLSAVCKSDEKMGAVIVCGKKSYIVFATDPVENYKVTSIRFEDVILEDDDKKITLHLS